MVGQRGSEIVKVAQRLALAVVTGDHARRVAVGKQLDLGRRPLWCVEAQPRRVVKRDQWARDGRYHADRARSLRQHLSALDLERLAQILVFGGQQSRPTGGRTEWESERSRQQGP